jgi:integrase
MPHGSLGIERVAVRRSANAGKGFRETHGLLGNLGKLFHVAVRRGRRTLQADRKKFSEYAVHPCGSPLPHALQGFAANAMPCAEVRPECDQGGFPHRAPFRPGHPCPTARPRPGHTRETWAPLGCTCTALPGTIWPKPLGIHGDSFLSTQKYAASIRVAAQHIQGGNTMPIVTLSHDFVSKAICPEGKKKIVYWDSAIKGFILEVRASGSTYALRFRDQRNSQKQHKIGSAKDISFEKARRAAEKARGMVVLNQDPSEEKRIKRRVPTLSYFVQFHYLPYIKKDKRSWKVDDSMLRCHIIPKFGSQHMDKICTQAVIDFHHGLVSTGLAKGTANRGQVLLKYMFNLALKWKVPGVTENPAAGVKLFEANNARERFLTAEETQRLLAAVEKSKNTQLKYIVPLLLLLGCRKRELLDARWEEFDLERRIWRISMSKSGKSRHVPLSKAALEIIQKLPRFEGCPYILPSPISMKPFSQIHKAWNNARIAAGIPDVRMHDLRHSMASNMVNSGRSLYEVSQVLGHSQLKTTQRYAHLSQETLLEAVDAAAEATGTDWGQ